MNINIANTISQLLTNIAAVAIVPVTIVIIAYIIFDNLARKDLDKELRPVREERREIHERLKDNAKESILDSIQLSLNQLTEYYVINKSQAKNSFQASLLLIILGFATIAFSISMFFFVRSPNLTISAISTASGMILQFIGAASFYVYRKSLEQLNYFFNQLIRMQDTMLAIQLTKELPDQGKHLKLMETLIISLVERSSHLPISAPTTEKEKKTPSSNHQLPTDYYQEQ